VLGLGGRMDRVADRPDTGVHLDRRALTNAIVDRPGLASPAQANGSKRAARAALAHGTGNAGDDRGRETSEELREARWPCHFWRQN
jgi:hypothetical protein